MATFKTTTWRIIFLLSLCLIFFPGCMTFGGGDENNNQSEKIGQMENQNEYTVKNLQDDLLEFAGNFEAYVRSASNEIRSGTDSKEMKKRSLLWKLRIVPMVHEIASRNEPQVDYVALAYLTRTVKQYLTVGEGKDIFGDQQSTAVQTASKLDQMILEIGEEFLTPEQIRKLKEKVQIYAEKNPIRGPDFSLEIARKSIQEIDRTNEFSWISNISLAPFGAMSGISAMPAATRDLSRTLWVTSHIIKHLPQLLRWQAELLLWDVEERDSVKNIVEGVSTIDETSRKTGERLELSGKSLITYTFLRVAGLLVLAFVLFLLYRIITHLFLTTSVAEQED